ncbi:unnamed protein product [Onchocerca ochengi]|uniref:PH domain-containing protein n=1 Tax=Onchocerca ochengi TaxID=42157 RepID=A0A182EA74_ONCOC|nr:unnamed protein product [Onchocerca ochengi]
MFIIRWKKTKQYSVGVYEIIEETVQFKPDFCALSEKKQHGTTVRVERKIMMNAVGVMENEEHQEGKHHQQYRREIPRSIPECSALHICSNLLRNSNDKSNGDAVSDPNSGSVFRKSDDASSSEKPESSRCHAASLTRM